MADNSLQERLREHAKAFDGLLSLIPAKMYYGEDTSDQWNKKKQTKEQAKAAKRNKLDPDSELHRNAKDVLDERARNKRKLRALEDDDEDESAESEDDADDTIIGVEKEKPLEGLKKRTTEDESVAKKPKLSEDATPATPKSQSEKQKAKEEKKAAKTAKKLQKEEAKKTKGKKAATGSEPVDQETAASRPLATQTPVKQPAKVQVDEDAEMVDIDVSGLVPQEDERDSADSSPKSPVFDSQPDTNNASVEPASTTTSISSTVPPSAKPKHIKVPADTTALRARLAAKLEALRAARKVVDEATGTPIRTRQDLIESRRFKQEQRKARKQEARRLAKEEEDKKREQALASARNSPSSLLSPAVDLDDDASNNNFSFGRLAFADGVQMSQDLSYEKSMDKKKGPMDPKSALAKFESQKKRLAALDDDKRKEVLEKEMWLAARRRAEGEKVHDDEAMLKKAVKRKEKAKKKSEKEWQERKKGVADAIKGRQHKREENLKKRRDEKGLKGKKKKAGASSIKKRNRPGFEGGFGGGGGKKK